MSKLKKQIITRDSASNFHKEVIGLLKEIYPHETIKQEFPAKINNHTLFIDIYLPKQKLCIEVDGKQHDVYIPFFHQSKSVFKNQQSLDELKNIWAKEQSLTLIRISHKDKLSKEFLMNKIIEVMKKGVEYDI